MVKAKTALAYIDQKRSFLVDLSDKIWEAAELALHETASAKYIADALEAEGFTIEAPVGGMPTAFVATWGDGGPVIGLLGEYDALGGVSQNPVPVRDERVPGGAGHACGHNLLGAGALAAAIGLKEEMTRNEIPGTVKYFGCPAEENLSGKAFMARDGLFDECDACLTWHPGGLNQVWTGSSLANNAMNVTFHGQTAHASADPYNGRSALDAVQLMNMGVEFLREHMPGDARVHYAILDGGRQPNVVPSVAKVWYLVRSPEREQVDDIYRRVLQCAEGAATMTETTYEVDLLKAIWNVLPNSPLEDILRQSMQAVGPPEFSEEEREFAREIAETFPPGNRESSINKEGLQEDERKQVLEQVLNDTLISPGSAAVMMGSTDVGDVSWCCPTAQIRVACNAIGTPGHSWQYVAQAGMSIGHRGMIQAGKMLAEAAFRLMTEPETLENAQDEFQRASGGKRYESAMPPDHQPAFEQFAGK